MTVERRPRQFLAVWSDDGKAVKGSTFEESLFVDGAFWKNELSSVPLDGFEQFGKMFSTELQTQHDQLVEDKAELTADLAAKTNEYDTTKASLDAKELELTAAKEALVKLSEEHKAVIDAKQSGLNVANATIAELQESFSSTQSNADNLQVQVDELTEMQLESTSLVIQLQGRLKRLLDELPFNPREISVGAFKARLFSVLETEDVVRLYAAQPDSTLEQIAGTITNWDHAFPIRLDSAELLHPLGYLVSINLLTVAEVANLRRDCTRAEAFIAPI